VVPILSANVIPSRIIRLTIINKSGYPVYLRLRGSQLTKAYYYLTIRAGSRDNPTSQVFTVFEDRYRRTTWQCNGLRSNGELYTFGNIQLTFIPCGEFLSSRYSHSDQFRGWERIPVRIYRNHIKAGEPRMEKVTFFKYANIYSGRLALGKSGHIDVVINGSCISWWEKILTYKAPVGCAFAYQY